MQLAIYQGSGTPRAIDKNLDLLQQTAQAAAARGADLLVLPELFLSGYNIGDAVHTLAQPAGSAAIQRICEIARSHHLAILLGYPEAEAGKVYNSALLVDQNGDRVANYRKTHLFGAEERRFFQPGDRLSVHAIGGIKIGVLICFDVEFPEAVRSLALQGAELILVPTANMFPYTQIPSLVVPVRALENQVFLAYVNRVGSEGELTYCGLSCVIRPDGKDLVRAGLEDEALLIAEIEVGAIDRFRQEYCYLTERRSDIYI